MLRNKRDLFKGIEDLNILKTIQNVSTIETVTFFE